MRFFNTSVTSRQCTPHPNKSFLQNYDDHVKLFLKDDMVSLTKDYTDPYKDKYAILRREIIARFGLFDSLCDHYDYFDEVIGATVIPCLSLFVVEITAIFAIIEGIYALAIRMRACRDDHADHVDAMINALITSGLALIFAASYFLKSVVSLCTRPLVTTIKGFKPQDKFRFYDEDSMENNPNRYINERATHFSNLFPSGQSQSVRLEPTLPAPTSWLASYCKIADSVISSVTQHNNSPAPTRQPVPRPRQSSPLAKKY